MRRIPDPGTPRIHKDLSRKGMRSTDATISRSKDGDSMNAVATRPHFADERLEALTLRRLGNRVRDLRVLRRPEGLVLMGRTTTYYAKQLAQHAIMEVDESPILANDIEVS